MICLTYHDLVLAVPAERTLERDSCARSIPARLAPGGGRFDRWVKVKNRQHPAFSRVQDQFG